MIHVMGCEETLTQVKQLSPLKKCYQIIWNGERVEWLSVCKICPKVSTSLSDSTLMLP